MLVDLQNSKKNYLNAIIESNVVKFGRFETKSGRLSPYFLNLGEINQGQYLNQVSQSYADHFKTYFSKVDQIFGPAYKGISIASTLVNTLWDKHQKNISFSYNRKEAKKHGEGGSIVGAMDKTKPVVIVEDVLTGGVSIHESIESCLLYTSPSPRDQRGSRMPSSA